MLGLLEEKQEFISLCLFSMQWQQLIISVFIFLFCEWNIMHSIIISCFSKTNFTLKICNQAEEKRKKDEAKILHEANEERAELEDEDSRQAAIREKAQQEVNQTRESHF